MNDTFIELIKEYDLKQFKSEKDIFDRIKQNQIDYSLNIKQFIFKQRNSKYRKVLVMKNDSLEQISLKYLKKRLDSSFRISYPNRQRIMRECFTITEIINSMSEFTIYKFDFKDFFNSVKSADVFNRYIKYSSLYRFEKDLLENITENFKYCSPGLPTSNALVELISRDFDIKLKSLLHDYGLIFYSRYVDDSLIIFNQSVEERKILDCIEDALNTVFKSSNIKLNKSKRSLIYSGSPSGTTYNYLGYLFEYQKEKEYKFFKYGIAEDKISKYRKKLIRIISEYKNDGNMELFRQRILFWGSRIVFYNTSRNKYSTSFIWDVLGIVHSYGELRNFLYVNDKIEKIEKETKDFLRNEIIQQVNNIIGYCPYFLKTKTLGYVLEDRLSRNKSIVFHSNIGWSKNYLIKMIKKIEPSFDPSKRSYRNLVTYYCKKLKL
ncbi:reverse transcriptase domain-containing protein [Metabacillus lacus]|nr:reverse transcriptase domain-containing protein [Metabacillus lacus]